MFKLFFILVKIYMNLNVGMLNLVAILFWMSFDERANFIFFSFIILVVERQSINIWKFWDAICIAIRLIDSHLKNHRYWHFALRRLICGRNVYRYINFISLTLAQCCMYCMYVYTLYMFVVAFRRIPVCIPLYPAHKNAI